MLHHYDKSWCVSGSCSGFKDAMEVYMATAGTKYKKFSEIYYDVRRSHAPIPPVLALTSR